MIQTVPFGRCSLGSGWRETDPRTWVCGGDRGRRRGAGGQGSGLVLVRALPRGFGGSVPPSGAIFGGEDGREAGGRLSRAQGSAPTIASGRGESVLMATPPQARCFGRARRGSANSRHEHVRGPPPLWATGPARSRPFGSGVRAGARCRRLLGFALLAVRLLGGVLRGGLLAALLHRTGEVDEGFEAFLVLLEALGARVDLADRALPGELDDLSRLDLLLADGVGIAVLARVVLGDYCRDFSSVSRERADPGDNTRVRKPRGWPRGGRNGSGVA